KGVKLTRGGCRPDLLNKLLELIFSRGDHSLVGGYLGKEALYHCCLLPVELGIRVQSVALISCMYIREWHVETGSVPFSVTPAMIFDISWSILLMWLLVCPSSDRIRSLSAINRFFSSSRDNFDSPLPCLQRKPC